MRTLSRTLAALALSWAAALGPIASAARADDESLAARVRAFREEHARQLDEAIVELRELIDEKSQALDAMEEELLEARKGLVALESLRDVEKAATMTPVPAAPATIGSPGHASPPDSPTASAPKAIPGTLDGVIPASAVATTEGGWQGVIRLSATPGGRLSILHECGDGSGVVQAGALQAEQVELRVASPDDARILARALRADGKPVVTWPDLRIAPDASPQPDRIDAMERTLNRLTETVDRIERRASPPAAAPAPAPAASTPVEPPADAGAIPPAPIVPN